MYVLSSYIQEGSIIPNPLNLLRTDYTSKEVKTVTQIYEIYSYLDLCVCVFFLRILEFLIWPHK